MCVTVLPSPINSRTCGVPHTCNTFGNMSFTAAGPWMWNNLPSYLRQDISYGQFKLQLKTFLFEINWPRHIVTVCLFVPKECFRDCTLTNDDNIVSKWIMSTNRWYQMASWPGYSWISSWVSWSSDLRRDKNCSSPRITCQQFSRNCR